MPEKDLYVLARELSKQFTKSKYKSFLVINKFVQSDVLEKFEDNISGFVTKEDFIRETFSLIEDWERLVEWFQEEDGHPSKPSVSPKPTENAAFNERMKNISQKGRILSVIAAWIAKAMRDVFMIVSHHILAMMRSLWMWTIFRQEWIL